MNRKGIIIGLVSLACIAFGGSIALRERVFAASPQLPVFAINKCPTSCTGALCGGQACKCSTSNPDDCETTAMAY